MHHDLHGKTAIVTGATSGIGRETAHGLARAGARVILASRSLMRAAATFDEILRDTGNRDMEIVQVDLSSQQSIHRFAAEVLQRHAAIHVLVNCAAVWQNRCELSEDGIELTWATNVLGYFLTTRLLLDRLRASAPARIINVVSEFAYGLDMTDVQLVRRRYNGMTAYAQSKQADRMLTWALARRLAGSGVVAHAVHPGTVSSGLYDNLRGVTGAVARALVTLLGRSPAAAAETVIWLATDPQIAKLNGRYWYNHRERRSGFRDPVQVEALWGLCERMTAGSGAARKDASTG